jgi:hypothetical protein
MKYNIKILKDTPFDKKYTVLSLEAFRLKYNYLINTHNSDIFLINYLKYEYLKDNLDINLADWFEVIEIQNKFKIGDWVWNETIKQALLVVRDNKSIELKPNYCTLDAVNNNPKIYKRLATNEESEYYDLISFCNGDVLISPYKCYYFHIIWRDLIGVEKNITKYLQIQKEFNDISTFRQYSSDIDQTWSCIPNGLKIGCKEIKHSEIMQIAKILKLN